MRRGRPARASEIPGRVNGYITLGGDPVVGMEGQLVRPGVDPIGVKTDQAPTPSSSK